MNNLNMIFLHPTNSMMRTMTGLPQIAMPSHHECGHLISKAHGEHRLNNVGQKM